MKIAILGTGMVGRTLADRLTGLGHQVTLGTRDVDATLARTGDFAEWRSAHSEVELATFGEAARSAELVINATSGRISSDVLTAAGTENLQGKVLLDLANPIDAPDSPNTLSVKDDDSLAERIQREFPEAKVVKALNTMFCGVMVDPGQFGDDSTVFISGNDADAKATVSALLREFGWKDIIDLGDISTARGPEMMLPLWLKLMKVLGTASFNLKVVR